MSLNEYFVQKLSKLLGVPPEKITDIYLLEYARTHYKKLNHYDSSKMGGHVAARFLKHVDESEFLKMQKENDDFLAQLEKEDENIHSYSASP